MIKKSCLNHTLEINEENSEIRALNMKYLLVLRRVVFCGV